MQRNILLLILSTLLCLLGSIPETVPRIPESHIVTLKPLETIVARDIGPESIQYDGVVFTGDVLLARHVERLMGWHGIDHPFGGLQLSSLHTGKAAIIGNFEASIPPRHIPTPNYHLRFSVQLNALEALRSAGFTHLSLANNHSYDYGITGYQHTLEQIEQFGLQSFGEPHATVGTSSITYLETNVGPVALIGINQTSGSVDYEALRLVLEESQRLSVKQIVSVHWGIEYDLKHHVAQRRLSEWLVREGVDLIIGHHPHVVQDIQKIGDVLVVYSLGNYVFDQYFSTDVQEGLVVTLDLKADDVVLNLHPVTSIGTRSQPRLQTEVERERFLKLLANRSQLDLREVILQGSIPVSWDLASSTKTAMIGQ